MIDINALRLRQATEADIPLLLELRKGTMLPHLERAGAPSDQDSLMARVVYRLEDAQLVYLGEEFVGLFKVSRTGREWMLVQVQVAPGWQGRGLGEALVRRLQEEAAAQRCCVVLDVLKGNPARRLYERLGFVVESESEGGLEYRMRYRPAGA